MNKKYTTKRCKIIRYARKAQQITQKELADAVGITQPYLSDIERGFRAGSTEVINKIGAHLSIRDLVEMPY